MKKFLKSLEFCIGIHVINLISIIFVGFVFSIFTKNFKEHFGILNTIGNFISLIILNSIFSNYNSKVLSKDIFKKVDSKKILYIILFGFGVSVFTSMYITILHTLIPSYTNVSNQLESISSNFIGVLVIVFFGPIYEEILYRRIIFEYLKKNYSIVTAIIFQALVFGVAHGNIVQSIDAFIGGILLALVYIYSNSLLGSIILHMVFNLIGIWLPEFVNITNTSEYIIILLAIISLIFSIYKMTRKDEKIYINNY